MKRGYISILSAVAMTALVLSGCGSSSSGTSSSEAASTVTDSTETASSTAASTEATSAEAASETETAEEYPQSQSGSVVTLKFNFVKSSSDPEYQWYAEYFHDIYEATNGDVGYELYPSEALGGSADVLEMAANGEDVVQDCDFSYLETYDPDISVGMAPYLIQKPEEIETLWKSDVGQEWEAALEEKGLHILDFHYFGTRELISSKKVTSRDEMSSLKIRCAATPMWNEVVRVLGGNATNTAWSETYQALSQGVADAAESPYGLLYSAKLYEPCKYIIQTDHLVAATTVIMSQATWEKLSEEDQTAINEVATEFAEKQVDRVTETSEEYKQKLADEGVEFVEIDKTPFIEAAQETPSHFPQWSEGIYDRVKEAIGE